MRRQGSIPYQFIKLRLISAQIFFHIGGFVSNVRRPNSFMGFLSIFCFFTRIVIWIFWQIFFAMLFIYKFSKIRNSFIRNLSSICSHISNKTNGISLDIYSLVKSLCNLHCSRGSKAKLSRRCLL